MNSTGRGGFFSGRVARILLGLNNLVILASSIIITGILAYFINWGYGGVHLVYNMVIVRTTVNVDKHTLTSVQAVLTLFFYIFAVVLPVLKSYRGYMLPLNLALTYLWLTSLIFSSQDYSGDRCSSDSSYPSYYSYYSRADSRCGLKHTIQAFQIIGLCVFLVFPSLTDITKLTCKQFVSLLQYHLRGADVGHPSARPAGRHRRPREGSPANYYHRYNHRWSGWRARCTGAGLRSGK
jgi:hypothetical protein